MMTRLQRGSLAACIAFLVLPILPASAGKRVQSKRVQRLSSKAPLAERQAVVQKFVAGLLRAKQIPPSSGPFVEARLQGLLTENGRIEMVAGKYLQVRVGRNGRKARLEVGANVATLTNALAHGSSAPQKVETYKMRPGTAGHLIDKAGPGWLLDVSSKWTRAGAGESTNLRKIWLVNDGVGSAHSWGKGLELTVPRR